MTNTEDGLPLFDNAKFHGDGYDQQKDFDRLKGNLKLVYQVMADHGRHTLAEISATTRVPEASVSACLRTLRNQYGFVIEKERYKPQRGTWVYWIGGGGMGVHSRQPRKMKPIGDAKLFGEMMRCIYAQGRYIKHSRAHEELEVDTAHAVKAWVDDMVVRVGREPGEA